MQIDLRGQVAVVTGGAQGIGRAIAEAFVANGAQVAIVDRETDAAAQTAQELSEHGGTVAAFSADVTDGPRVVQVANEITTRFGDISLLVNNAGINTVRDRRPIHEYSDADWQAILAVDLTGLFAVSKAIIPSLLKRGSGRIINIASVAGLVPLRLQSAFVAAKAGVINLTKSMALELGPRGILTNAIAPGSILTRGTKALFYAADGSYSQNAASLISHIPVGRPGNAEEVAHAALFLAAPESSYINGAILTVDGGWTAGYTRDW